MNFDILSRLHELDKNIFEEFETLFNQKYE